MNRSVQRKIQNLIGLPETRIQHVARELFASTEQHPAVYWVYLAISAGIAFFGLVMNSTAVVIGAMLVSPLMTPLVQTGMAFAAGNLYLALRSLIRVFLSTLGVVVFAALTTMILPFEQITPEIAARTQPNALDLFVALFCAVVASLTTARQASDTVTAAAGTAISIALVPPLCVMGFGLGILDGRVFMGSTLLFIANLAAIILVSDLFFLLVGFAHVDVELLEEQVVGDRQKASRTYRFVKSLHIAQRKTLRWARLKIALPLVFVVIVALPLSSALSQVAWEVNTKTNINRVLAEYEKKYRILSRQQILDGRKVTLRLTIVGDPEKRGDRGRPEGDAQARHGRNPQPLGGLHPVRGVCEQDLQDGQRVPQQAHGDHGLRQAGAGPGHCPASRRRDRLAPRGVAQDLPGGGHLGDERTGSRRERLRLEVCPPRTGHRAHPVQDRGRAAVHGGDGAHRLHDQERDRHGCLGGRAEAPAGDLSFPVPRVWIAAGPGHGCRHGDSQPTGRHRCGGVPQEPRAFQGHRIAQGHIPHERGSPVLPQDASPGAPAQDRRPCRRVGGLFEVGTGEPPKPGSEEDKG